MSDKEFSHTHNCRCYLTDDVAKRISERVHERLARYLRRRKQIKLSHYVCMGFSQN